MRWASIRGTNMMSATIAFGCSRDALGWLCQRVWFRFAQAICSWCRVAFDTRPFSVEGAYVLLFEPIA